MALQPRPRAQWRLIEAECNPEFVVIADLGGPGPSLTNDAEAVVSDLLVNELLGPHGRRRVLYYDSAGRLDEILHVSGRVTGFAPGPKNWPVPMPHLRG